MPENLRVNRARKGYTSTKTESRVFMYPDKELARCRANIIHPTGWTREEVYDTGSQDPRETVFILKKVRGFERIS